MTPLWTLRIGGRNNSRNLIFHLFFLKTRSDIHNKLEISGKAYPLGDGISYARSYGKRVPATPDPSICRSCPLAFPLTGDCNWEKILHQELHRRSA